MGVGTSMGAYYDDAFHQAAAAWDSKYDNNVIDPDTQGVDGTLNDKNVIDPSVKTDDFITPVANVTNTPGEIMEGVEGVRMFPQGYGSRGGPTAQMRRSANDNKDLRESKPSMVESKAMDAEIKSRQSMVERWIRGQEIVADRQTLVNAQAERPLNDIEKARLNRLDKEHEQHFGNYYPD